MKNKIPGSLCLLLLAAPAIAQFNQPVFPTLSGQELKDSLVSTFKPTSLMPQAMARDTLFGKIDNHNDSLTCVYTGYTIWLDPTEDPTQAAFQNGGPDGLNTEHTYPQSLGASGLAEGDMHHLYPARADVNAYRGNSPFAEIPDDQTEHWYFLDQDLTNPPASNLDFFSEKNGDLFEPREDHKGNVARSMMYFYTMYKAQADAENPAFFETQRQTLCAWHYLDPVDAAEWNRTWQIAPFQQGKPNPFVLDCTLPGRSWCADFGETCTTPATQVVDDEGFVLEQNAPNPFSETTLLRWKIKSPGFVRLEVFNALGEKIGTPVAAWQPEGEYSFSWKKEETAGSGLLFCRLTLSAGGRTFSTHIKMHQAN